MDVYCVDRDWLLTIGADQVLLINKNKLTACCGRLLVWAALIARGRGPQRGGERPKAATPSPPAA
jgi:hypothetical protein